MFHYYNLPPLETETRDLYSEREEGGEVTSFYKEFKEKIEQRDMDEKKH